MLSRMAISSSSRPVPPRAKRYDTLRTKAVYYGLALVLEFLMSLCCSVERSRDIQLNPSQCNRPTPSCYLSCMSDIAVP